MINIKNFHSNLLERDKKSYKSIDIYYIGYITMKDLNYVNINTVNPLYFMIDNADGFIEEKGWNKYLTLVSTNKTWHIAKIYRAMG